MSSVKRKNLYTLVVIFFLCIGIMIIYFIKPPNYTSEIASDKAKVFFVDGEAYISTKTTKTPVLIEKGTEISDKAKIITAKNSSVEIGFGPKNDNYVKITENTDVEFGNILAQKKKNILVNKGGVFFLLNNLEKDSSFKVKTPQAVCGVVGTDFQVALSQDATIVKVYEGKVNVTSLNRFGFSNKEKIELPESKKVEIKDNKVSKFLGELSEQETQQWQKLEKDIDRHLFETFYVYADRDSEKNHFSPSGWVGDYDAIRREESEGNAYSGQTCIKFTYTAKTPQGAGWAGVCWQNPVNNWGEIHGGYNLKGAQKLTFWARGENGEEVINRFGIGGIGGNFPDSATREIGPIFLTKEWKQYDIDLDDVDLSYISGGFYWMTSKEACPGGIVFYVDEIRYE